MHEDRHLQMKVFSLETSCNANLLIISAFKKDGAQYIAGYVQMWLLAVSPWVLYTLLKGFSQLVMELGLAKVKSLFVLLIGQNYFIHFCLNVLFLRQKLYVETPLFWHISSRNKLNSELVNFLFAAVIQSFLLPLFMRVSFSLGREGKQMS